MDLCIAIVITRNKIEPFFRYASESSQVEAKIKGITEGFMKSENYNILRLLSKAFCRLDKKALHDDLMRLGMMLRRKKKDSNVSHDCDHLPHSIRIRYTQNITREAKRRI
jgi:hypothetical protein